MKSSMRILAAIGLMVLLSAASAFAQTVPLQVNVPFQFMAGEKAFAAGVYRVQVDSQFRRLDMRAVDAVSGVSLSAHSTQRPHVRDRACLVFHKYGNTYFLKQVWSAGRTDGWGLPATSAEREMAKNARVQMALVQIP